MKTLVVYDSAYGNTAKVAQTISAAVKGFGTSTAKEIKNVNAHDFDNLDVLVLGSPTQAGRPTKPMAQFINDLPTKLFMRSKVAVFDTRFEPKSQKRFLRIVMKILGFASPKMAKSIARRGGDIAGEPQGFIVNDTEGPLHEGEVERAAGWARTLTKTLVSA